MFYNDSFITEIINDITTDCGEPKTVVDYHATYDKPKIVVKYKIIVPPKSNPNHYIWFWLQLEWYGNRFIHPNPAALS